MGCQRLNVLDGELPVDTAVVEVAWIPKTVCEGQMTFKNNGTNVTKVKIGLTRNSNEVTLKRYSIALGPNESFTEEGIVPGQIAAIGDVAGGLLSYYISYSETQA